MSALRDQTEPVGILRELARSTWAKANDGAECPPALAALTPADLAAWLPECPESAGAEAIGRDEALGFLAGDVAGYVTGGRAPGPSLGMDLPALFAIAAPGRGAGAAKVEHCVRYVHRRWLAYHAGALRMESTDDNLLRWTAPPVGGWPAVAHPLAPLVDAWQRWKKANDTTAPPDAKTRTAGGLIRLPYAATETVRRAWRPAAEVAAVEVDGEPLTARLLDARPDPTARRTGYTSMAPTPAWTNAATCRCRIPASARTDNAPAICR